MAAHDPLSELANAAEGDVAAAHACACQLLAGGRIDALDGRDARLLLTSVCLHLHTHGAADLTASDLVSFLGGQGPEEILAILRDNPLSVTEYAGDRARRPLHTSAKLGRFSGPRGRRDLPSGAV